MWENARGGDALGESHAHARLGPTENVDWICCLFPFRDCPFPSRSPLCWPTSSGLNSNRVVSPRRAVLRGCYPTRARKYATSSDVCVDDGARLLRRQVDREKFLKSFIEFFSISRDKGRKVSRLLPKLNITFDVQKFPFNQYILFSKIF